MGSIYVRTAVLVVQRKRLLLVPHFTENGALWYLPGGGVDFLESLEDAAKREFEEETGFHAKLTSPPTVIQCIDPDEPYHSLTFAYSGEIVGGELRPEPSRWGPKLPKWFSREELSGVQVVPYLQKFVTEHFADVRRD